MATRLPPLNELARSPALEETSPSSTSSLVPGHPVTSIAAISDSNSVVKVEDSPTPSALASADADTPAPDAGGAATAVAGRKRKLNSNSARGVANLTPEQLAKKRANDRQAQRAIRERTKAHIDLLEQQVRDLSSQKPYLDLQAALKQNEAVQVENRELKQGLKAVLEIIQPLLGDQAKSGRSHLLSSLLRQAFGQIYLPQACSRSFSVGSRFHERQTHALDIRDVVFLRQ